MTDQEHLSQYSKIEIYAQILLGILRHTPTKETECQLEYNKSLIKNLKFRNENDHKLLRACIDALEDTEYAINEVYKNGLCVNLGEKYLRLIGVLNSIYSQFNAVKDILKLFNIEKQAQIIENIGQLNIIILRNKIASHSTRYLIPNTEPKEFDFFRLTQTSLKTWGKRLEIVGKNSHETINLISEMNKFSKEIELALDKVIRQELERRYFKKEALEWLDFRYKYTQS